MSPALHSAQRHSLKEGAGLAPAQTRFHIIEWGSHRRYRSCSSHVSPCGANTPTLTGGADQSNPFSGDHIS